MSEMNVGVQAGGTLDRQGHAYLLCVRHARRDHGTEPLGGLLPRKGTAAAGEHVDGARPNLGGGVDHGGERFPRGLRLAG